MWEPNILMLLSLNVKPSIIKLPEIDVRCKYPVICCKQWKVYSEENGFEGFEP